MTSGKFATTLGYERRFSPAFLYDRREEFIAFMTHGQPSRPANMQQIVAINQGRRPLAMQLPDPKPLSPPEVHALLSEGRTTLLDIRDVTEFGAGHAAGSLNIQLVSSQFEQRVGWVAPEGNSLVLLADGEPAVRAALHRLAFIGLEARVAGYLEGGLAAWAAGGFEIGVLPQRTVEQVFADLQEAPMQLLDVREPDEWNAGHMAGARNLSYKQLPEQLGEMDLDPGRPLVVACAGGYRSSTAASVLLAAGFREVINLTGGMDAWKAAGLPLEALRN